MLPVLRQAVLVPVLGFAALSANAALLHNQNVTNNVIMGSGINNGGFTVERADGVEVGLRARERYNLSGNVPTQVTGSNGNGTFNQNAGEPPGFGGAGQNRARWNFDWSINTGTANVNAYTYRLGIDFDAGAGTNFLTFDPVMGVLCADHSFGNNSTAQGGGTEVAGAASSSACAGAFAASDATQYAGLRSSNNLVQNSWNFDFFDSTTFPFDPTANGNYSIFLEVIGSNGVVARSDITVIVGTGATVPEPGALALVGLALAGAVAARRRRS